jgi:hypothetical protein
MLQLKNETPFKTAIAVFPDRAGVDTVYVMIKGTCTLRPGIALAEEQVPVIIADEYLGEPALSSLKIASDYHIGKPGTDVLLVGHAWAPGGQAVTESTVTVTVAERSKTIRVIGDRVWRNGRPTDPLPFESMPLVWERAYGGFDNSTDQVLAEERNPVGVGFKGAREADEFDDQPVPNLEDPRKPLQKLGQIVDPVCFAPIAPSWLPRRSFAGTYDAKWQRKRAPYLPEDFDARFLQCATPELAFDRYLQGGEQVNVDGATPDAPISFTIPAVRLSVEATVAGASQTPTVNLETLLIEPDLNRASFTWRAAIPADRKVLKVETVVVSLNGSARA